MTGKINFINLVRQLLPLHKRQAVRLRFLRALVTPLQSLFDHVASWRTLIRMEINVTSQVRVLEGYLRNKYGDRRIQVLSFANLSPQVSLRREGNIHRMSVGLREEKARAAVPLRGEIRSLFGNADFVVLIPPGIDRELIGADIERFKQALVTYKIKNTESEQ